LRVIAVRMPDPELIVRDEQLPAHLLVGRQLAPMLLELPGAVGLDQVLRRPAIKHPDAILGVEPRGMWLAPAEAQMRQVRPNRTHFAQPALPIDGRFFEEAPLDQRPHAANRLERDRAGSRIDRRARRVLHEQSTLALRERHQPPFPTTNPVSFPMTGSIDW